LLYIAHVVDPCTKLKALKYYLVKCSGSDWAKQIETNVKDLLNRLWEQYDKLYGRHLSNLDAGVESSSVASIDVSVDDDDDDALTETKYMKFFMKHLEEENNSECMSKVDRYFLDGCEASTNEFDILL
jgi:hypothetical protein